MGKEEGKRCGERVRRRKWQDKGREEIESKQYTLLWQTRVHCILTNGKVALVMVILRTVRYTNNIISAIIQPFPFNFCTLVWKSLLPCCEYKVHVI